MVVEPPVYPAHLAVEGFQHAQAGVDARQPALNPLHPATQIGDVGLQPVELVVLMRRSSARVWSVGSDMTSSYA